MALNCASSTMMVDDDLPITGDTPDPVISTSQHSNADSDDLQFVDNLDMEPDSPIPKHNSAIPSSAADNEPTTTTGIDERVSMSASKQQSCVILDTNKTTCASDKYEWITPCSSQPDLAAMDAAQSGVTPLDVSKAMSTSAGISSDSQCASDSKSLTLSFAANDSLNQSVPTPMENSSVMKSEDRLSVKQDLSLGESFEFDPTYNNSQSQEKSHERLSIPVQPQQADVKPSKLNIISTIIKEDISIPVKEESLYSHDENKQDTEDKKTDVMENVTKIIKHFIEGFVIEESTSPFPVHRSSLLTELQMRTKKKVTRRRGATAGLMSQTPSHVTSRASTPVHMQHQMSVTESLPSTSSNQETVIPAYMTDKSNMEPCSLCGTPCVNLCFYRGGAYCSRRCIKKRKSTLFADPATAPPKRGRPIGAMTRNKPTFRNSGKLAKVIFSRYRPKSVTSDGSTESRHAVKQEPSVYSQSDMGGRFPAENGYESEDSVLHGSENHYTPDDSSGYKRGDVFHWTISDVRDFIQALPGCDRYARDFEEQEVDGRALLLLNEDHLLNALDIKLGPALKIYNHINSFR